MEAPDWATHIAKWIDALGDTIVVFICDEFYQYDFDDDYTKTIWKVEDWERAVGPTSEYKGTVLPVPPISLENK